MVAEVMIVNCFRKAGFKQPNVDAEELKGECVEDEELFNLWDELKLRGEAADETAQEYVNIDLNVATTGEFSMEEIINELKGSEMESSEDEEFNEISEEEVRIVSAVEARTALATLRQYLEQNCGDQKIMKKYDGIEEYMENNREKKKTQSKITDFIK